MVAGASGSGKTSRVPLRVADICGPGLVIVPKRLMATRSCHYMKEQGWCTSAEVGVAIGAITKFGTRITFMITEWFIHAYSSDPSLGGYKLVILDAIHEREVVADIICIYNENTMNTNPTANSNSNNNSNNNKQQQEEQQRQH